MKGNVALRRDESFLYKGRTARSFGGLRMTTNLGVVCKHGMTDGEWFFGKKIMTNDHKTLSS
jgi:hypothetical protein